VSMVPTTTDGKHTPNSIPQSCKARPQCPRPHNHIVKRGMHSHAPVAPPSHITNSMTCKASAPVPLPSHLHTNSMTTQPCPSAPSPHLFTLQIVIGKASAPTITFTQKKCPHPHIDTKNKIKQSRSHAPVPPALTLSHFVFCPVLPLFSTKMSPPSARGPCGTSRQAGRQADM
jgi:hypothetical protein